MDMKFKLAKNDSNKGGRFSGKSIHCVTILLDGSKDDLQDAFVTTMRQVAASRVDNVAFLLSSVAGLALKDIINYAAKYFIGWLLKASPDNVFLVVLCVTRREEFQEASATLSETLDKWFESKTNVANLAPVIVTGELDKTVADVLVNTTSPDLDFSSGQVSSALLKQAGKLIQRECEKTYKNGIGHGEVAVTDGYNLNCKKVFHISLPPYDKTEQEKCYEYVVKIVRHCLRKANELGYLSIAFPAIGTGKLGYPEDILISMLFTGVETFKAKTDTTSLEDVQFVIFPGEEHLVYLFETFGDMFIRGKAETTKFEKETSMKITITGSKENVENTKSGMEQYLVDQNELITECLYDVNEMQYRAMEEIYGDSLTSIKERGFEINHNKKKNTLEFIGKRKTVKSIQELLEQLKGLHQRLFTVPTGLDQKLINDVLSNNRLRNNGVYLALDSDETSVNIFATTEERCEEAFKMVTKRLKTRNLQPQQKPQKNSVRRLDEGNTTKSEFNSSTKELPTQETIETGLAKENETEPKDETVEHSPKTNDRCQVKDTKTVKQVGEFRIQNVLVTIWKEGILNAQVDCIVNAADKDLNHREGISALIAKAAGETMLQECKERIDENRGPFQATSIIVTAAGNLHFKHILHSVGPFCESYRPFTTASLKQCKKDLNDTIRRCLYLANEYEFTSIAFSSFSSGIFAIPAEICAEQYAEALLDFEGTKSSVREVSFWDTHSGVLGVIHKTFSAMISERGKSPWTDSCFLENDGQSVENATTSYTHNKNKKNTARSKPQSKVQSMDRKCPNMICPAYLPNGRRLTVSFGPVHVVEIFPGDIFKCAGMDCFVCQIGENGEPVGKIAQTLQILSGRDYLTEKSKLLKTKKFNICDVIITKGGHSRFGWIIHTVVSRSSKDVSLMYRNIFKAICDEGFVSVALPLLGADESKEHGPKK